MALKSQGSALWFLGPANVPGLVEGAVYRLKGVKSYEMPRGQRGQIPTSTLDDDVDTFMAGTLQPGTASFPIDPDGGTQGHKELETLYQSGATTQWCYGYSDGTAAPTATRGIGSITVTAAGTGYTSAPTVTFTGGAGTGAAATAVVENGVIVRIDVTAAGTGYTSAPTIGFTGGGGSGATATSELAYQLVVPTTRTTEYFSGYVQDSPVSAGLNQAISSQIGVQLSGKVTRTWKS